MEVKKNKLFFEKKNQIKLDKIFEKKNEIFVENNFFKCIINCLALPVNARTMRIH